MDTDRRDLIRYWVNIPNGLAPNLPESRVVLGAGNIKTNVDVYSHGGKVYFLGMYYLDGKQYDFRLKEIDGTTRDTLSDRRFRAIRIK